MTRAMDRAMDRDGARGRVVARARDDYGWSQEPLEMG